jgi:hypothetical protein
MTTELWAVIGTTLATFVFVLLPGVVYAWYVLDRWIDEEASYSRPASVEAQPRR